jgi:hypothetical protein
MKSLLLIFCFLHQSHLGQYKFDLKYYDPMTQTGMLGYTYLTTQSGLYIQSEQGPDIIIDQIPCANCLLFGRYSIFH